MKHFTFGYARVSTEQQNLDRQLDMLRAYGVDHIYNEKMTGTKRDRPELTKLLVRMEGGDTVVIESLSRLGRSTKDLIALVVLFEQRGVHLISLKELNSLFYEGVGLSEIAVRTMRTKRAVYQKVNSMELFEKVRQPRAPKVNTDCLCSRCPQRITCPNSRADSVCSL